MLDSVNLNDKSYDELLTEAIAKIPLYSKEWTNFNPSDPGITLLQNLTAFQLLQQEAINTVSDEAKRKLLKLVGYVSEETRAAKILVQAPSEGGPILPSGYQLFGGEIPFETTETVQLQPWGLEAVYVHTDEGFRDITRFVDDSTDVFAYPFGSKPQAGDSLNFVLSGMPEIGVPIHMWFGIAEEELRTPFGDETEIPAFSRVRWQYYTDKGWRDVEVRDETIGLLRTGAVTFTIDEDSPAIFNENGITGYALRCVLDKADYDRVPRLKSVAVHLFPMVQKNTSIQCIVCSGGDRIALRGRLPKLGNIRIYCKESADAPYRMYHETATTGNYGRYYTIEETEWGLNILFDPESGNVPCDAENAIRVVCYDNEMIHHRRLGKIYGYDRQTIKLENVENVLPESLLLMVEKKDEAGESEYYFVAPGDVGTDGFSYHVRPEESEIVIDEAGFCGCEIELVHCACTLGSRGNLRAGSVLEQRGGYDGTEIEATFRCPAPGRGGVSYESTEELRRRFSAGMQKTTVAVRTEDFEKLVLKTPGLCIHKVKAVADGKNNLVRIVVKPHIDDELPKLSEEYLEKIKEYIEPRRLLTTRFEICQPKYTPIGVTATISVRGMASYAREKIEKLIRELLDHVNGEGRFGDGILFNDAYKKISALPFVEAIDALRIIPESRDAHLKGSDICTGEDCLCYPGTIKIDIREYGR